MNDDQGLHPDERLAEFVPASPDRVRAVLVDVLRELPADEAEAVRFALGSGALLRMRPTGDGRVEVIVGPPDAGDPRRSVVLATVPVTALTASGDTGN